MPEKNLKRLIMVYNCFLIRSEATCQFLLKYESVIYVTYIKKDVIISNEIRGTFG